MNKKIHVDTNDIKFADTGTTINVSLKNNDDEWADTSYTPLVKFSAISLGTISDVSGKWVNNQIVVDSGSLVGLPVDKIRIEVWLMKGDDTLIFPDDGFGKININYNSKGATW